MRSVGWIGVVIVCVASGLVFTSLHLQKVRKTEFAAQAEQATARLAGARTEAARIAGLQAEYERQVALYGRAIDPKVLVTSEGVEAARQAVADYRAACARFDAGLARSDNKAIAQLRPLLQDNQAGQAVALDRLLDFLTDHFGGRMDSGSRPLPSWLAGRRCSSKYSRMSLKSSP